MACILFLFLMKCNLEMFTYQLLQIHELDVVIPILQMRRLRLEYIEPVASGPPGPQGRAGIWVQLNHVVKCWCCGVRAESRLFTHLQGNLEIGLASLGLSFFLCKMGLFAVPTQRGYWEDVTCDSACQVLSPGQEAVSRLLGGGGEGKQSGWSWAPDGAVHPPLDRPGHRRGQQQQPGAAAQVPPGAAAAQEVPQ